MDAGGPGGRSSRGSTRLQPEPSAPTSTPDLFSPVTGEVLLSLLGDGLDEHEQRDRTIDHEQLQRRWADQQQLIMLRNAGFEGFQYEMFTGDLAAYGYPVIRSWLRRGLIFQYCAERGRPAKVVPRDREYLSAPGNTCDAADDRREISLETNAKALKFFRTHILLPGKWSMDKGASVSTYYVGACLFAFPNVYQRWAAERRRSAPVLPDQPITPDEVAVWTPHGTHLGVDPATDAVSMITVQKELDAMPPRTREVAVKLVHQGMSFGDIGEQLGISARAVEGLLYRYRSEARRRNLRGRLA